MVEQDMPEIVRTLIKRRAVIAEDVLALRREVFGDGAVSPHEAIWLFAINRAAEQVAPEWNEMFVEAMVDFIVRQAAPPGHVSEGQATWLIHEIKADGRIERSSEFEALVKILETADRCPAVLSGFALAQVEDAVLNGYRGARGGRTGAAGRITADDVELVRRVLYAHGGDGNIGITREEAEVLFNLNDRTAGADNDPAWADLFVGAVANFLMHASGYRVPTREEALSRERFLADSGGVANFLGRMFSSGPREVVEAFDEEDPYEQRIREAARARGLAEPVTVDEAQWLADRIGRDGRLTANEKALLTFLREESPDVHPALKSLIDAA